MIKNHDELIEKLRDTNGFHAVLSSWYEDYISECKKTFSLSLCHYEELKRLYGCINGAI